MKPVTYSRLIDWARAAALPLDQPLAALAGPLRALIGDARVVSLGEGLHGAHEPLEFRNELFAWLVEHLGFGAIALESGLSSGLSVDAYVRGGAGEAEAVAARGITSGLHGFPGQARLLRWMRSHGGLCFHGIDTSPLAGALDVALRLLDDRDAATAAALRARLAPFCLYLEVDRTSLEPRGYTLLDAGGREALSELVDELVAVTEPLSAVAAHALRQAEAYLKTFPAGWSAAQGPAAIWPSVALSDRQKADNVAQLAAAGGRLLLFSHLGHASTRPVSIRLGADIVPLPEMMGSHLARRLGAGQLLTLGHLIGDNQCQPPVGAAPTDSLEGRLTTLGHEAFLLDLRCAPPDVRAELEAAPHPLHGQLPVHQLSPGLGIDVIFFTRLATAAR